MSRKDIVIDRFEEGKAVCKAGRDLLCIDISRLPPSVREGDVIVKKGEVYSVDEARTRQRRADAEALLKSVLKP